MQMNKVDVLCRRSGTASESLASRSQEIQQVEERLVRDLQTCIDSTNKLLECLGKVADLRDDSTPGEPSSGFG